MRGMFKMPNKTAHTPRWTAVALLQVMRGTSPRLITCLVISKARATERSRRSTTCPRPTRSFPYAMLSQRAFDAVTSGHFETRAARHPQWNTLHSPMAVSSLFIFEPGAPATHCLKHQGAGRTSSVATVEEEEGRRRVDDAVDVREATFAVVKRKLK